MRRRLLDRRDLGYFEEELIADGGLTLGRCLALAAIALVPAFAIV
jgi:hypothetical protein